jgi:FixJ family two-component response regulator
LNKLHGPWIISVVVALESAGVPLTWIYTFIVFVTNHADIRTMVQALKTGAATLPRG